MVSVLHANQRWLLSCCLPTNWSTAEEVGLDMEEEAAAVMLETAAA
jgi:hypothetical protein